MGIKIFEMNDCDWYAGETAEDCLVEICKDWGETRETYIRDYDYPELSQLTDEQMEKLTFCYDMLDGPTVTFKERLDEMIKDEFKFPCFFASTEY